LIEGLLQSRLDVRSRRIVKAVCSGGAARLLTSLVSLLSLPLCVRYLGPERFGVWATITTTAVWINLLDLGIGNTLTNHVSRAYALDDKEAAGRYFTNAVVLTSAASAMAGLIFAFPFRVIDWSRLLNIRTNLTEVTDTIAIAAGLALAALPCNLSSKVLAGYQQLHRFSYASAAGALASLLGLAAGIVLHVRMPVLYLMSAGCIVAANFVLLLTEIFRRPWLFPRRSALDWHVAKELFASGSLFLLIQIAAVVVFSSDNLIVSHYLGPGEVTPYSVTWRLAGLTATLQALMFPAVWPAYAEAFAAGDYRWIRQTFSAMIRGVALLNFIGAAALVLFGRPFIRLWAGVPAVPSMSLLCAMAFWAVMSGLMSVESCLLASLNRIRAQAILSMVAAILNVSLSIMLVRRIGAVGVICGTILSYLVVLVVPQTLIVREVWKRELRADERTSLSPLRPSEIHAGGDD
jgi:O-antigen/teichoic acid export membrane protein